MSKRPGLAQWSEPSSSAPPRTIRPSSQAGYALLAAAARPQLATLTGGIGSVSGKLAPEGITAAGFPADVTDRPALAAALDGAAGRFGRIDVLR